MPTKTEQLEIDQLEKFTSPKFLAEAMIMFPLAIILDLIPIILLFIGLDDFWIIDIIGLVLIGGWMFIRSGNAPKVKQARKKAKKMTKKMGRKILKRLGLTFLGEATPYLGSILPLWTLAVFFELKNN